jgi:hypothetical protein
MKLPAMVEVKSSNIKALGYDNRGLFVRFIGGGAYHYPDAPKSVFDELVGAESVGKTFRSKVGGVYKHKLLDDAQPHSG